MEIRRFGVGHRRREALPGTVGVTGKGIHSDERGYVGELAFAAHAHITPHTNPNTTYFIVIEGGGYVIVGEERARIASGEAVIWPPNVLHGAWTETTPMRAIVVEFAGEPTSEAHRLLLDGVAERLEPGTPDAAPGGSGASPADGALAPRPAVPLDAHVSPDEEPW